MMERLQEIISEQLKSTVLSKPQGKGRGKKAEQIDCEYI